MVTEMYFNCQLSFINHKNKPKNVHVGLASQTVAYELVALASPESLLETQTLRPHSRPTELETF